MRVVITGGTGLIGSALARHLGASGYDAVVLTRNVARVGPLPPGVRAQEWDGLTSKGWSQLVDGETYVVSSTPEDLTRLREALEQAGYTLESVGLQMVPKTTVAIAEESTAKQVVRLVGGLEDNDDVQDVYANFDIPEAVLEAVAS